MFARQLLDHTVVVYAAEEAFKAKRLVYNTFKCCVCLMLQQLPSESLILSRQKA